MLRFSKRAFLEAYPDYGYRWSNGEGDGDLRSPPGKDQNKIKNAALRPRACAFFST